MGCGSPRVRPRLALCVLLASLAAPAFAAGEPGAVANITPLERARVLWEAGHVLHARGDYDGAVEAFRASIAAHPTAEGHTFLGWSLSHLGRLEEAIAHCRTAIELDPDFGNPYNDIGVYLMDLQRPQEAAQWFEKAIAAPRYCCYEFPHFNLGRLLLEQGRIEEAERSLVASIKANPDYLPPRLVLELLRAARLQGL